ncbi:efflux RND transporter periplasmic adaptor subunit [Piscinibacter sakaiensis]|uniref:efflux RND transporter periplasmic adaptor subunit n=1 Tax=Piscinibacter sakaiensis TaxID=1547922 RepID=UPI001E49D578|nr:efflux RND transporter periplasmic adaptor subunit [Piscinibacter sakaiensis]
MAARGNPAGRPQARRPAGPAAGARPVLAAGLAAALLALGACSGEAGPGAKPAGGGAGGGAAGAAAPKEVGIVTLKAQPLTLATELSGRTSPYLIAEIRPQVGGIVQRRVFTEGATVKAGEVLYQLDPASFQATFNSAQAAVRKAEATLASARSTAARNAELVKIDAISQQANEATQAAQAQAEADLGIARAALETARINLAYTRIVAPIPGRVGVSAVTPGALVTANQTASLTTVQQLDPIYVDVTQSSAEVLRLKRDLASGRLQRGARGEARMKLTLEDGSAYPHEGRLAVAGVEVDASTGNIRLRAVVPNPDGLLMPGMYVRGQIEEGVRRDALLVPQQAVTRNANGAATALVVDAEDKVARRPVQVDRAIGNRWLLGGGLAAGDRVIVEGAIRVKVGDKVRAVEVAVRDSGPARPAGAPGAAASGASVAGGGSPMPALAAPAPAGMAARPGTR